MSSFSPASRKRLVTGLFLSQLDYGDTIYRFACPSTLALLDPLYHAALRNISNSGYRTHHCTLYSLVGWPSIAMRRLQHWYLFLYRAILCRLPMYIRSKFVFVQNTHDLRSNNWLGLKIPSVWTETGERSLS